MPLFVCLFCFVLFFFLISVMKSLKLATFNHRLSLPIFSLMFVTPFTFKCRMKKSMTLKDILWQMLSFCGLKFFYV